MRRMRNKKYDKVFFWTVIALMTAGIFILSSASMGLLSKEGISFSSILIKRFAFGVIPGLILMFFFSRINYKKWRKFALPLFIFAFLLTILVFISPFGVTHGGAKRWLSLGTLSFQPSELLKFAFIVYVASWISARKEDLKSFKFGFLPFLVIVGFVAICLVLQPDIGTLGVIAITSVFMFFLGGGKFSQLALMIALGIALLYVLTLVHSHAAERILVFLNPSLDPQGIGYQMNQSRIAIGAGGIFGRGFGMSAQKFYYLPEPIGDSIFAVFCEEFGFVGAVSLIGLFLFLLYRGFRIVLDSSDEFAKLLGAGIIISIVLQAFINISAMIGFIPLTGLPLVFISHGGTALAMALAEIGVLLNISKNSQ